MQAYATEWGSLHYRIDGRQDGPTVVFANSLGTDLRLWDEILPLLPDGLCLLRHDMRGHGLSDLGGRSSSIEDLADDVIALIEATANGPMIFVGLSIGGLIAQSVAARRPDLVKGLVISNSAARLGTADSWRARIAALDQGGMDAIADAVMERWFAAAFRATPALALWRNMLLRTPAQGYAAACAAIADADLSDTLAGLTLPTLVIAGAEDGATPPDLVEATAARIRGAAFHVIPGAGHLPCVETPAAFAALLVPFLKAHT